MSVSKAYRQGFVDTLRKMASASELPEPLLQYAEANVYDKARNWMSPEELADYMDLMYYPEPMHEKKDGTLDKKSLVKALRKKDLVGIATPLDSRTVPYKRHRMLFGLLPDSIDEDPLGAVVDDSGTQRLRKMETDLLRNMYTTGEDEDREEVRRLLKSYMFKHDLDDLINGK